MATSQHPLRRRLALSCAVIALALLSACAATSQTVGSQVGASASTAASGLATTSPASAQLSPTFAPHAHATQSASVVASAGRSTEVACTASVSNPTPKRGMPTHVIVSTVSGAQVSVTATSTASTASTMVVPQHITTADAEGRADLSVTAETSGETVAVHVHATKAGVTAQCATSFTPVDFADVSGSPGLPPIQVTTQPIPPANADD